MYPIKKCGLICLLIGIGVGSGCSKKDVLAESVDVSEYLMEEALDINVETDTNTYIMEEVFEDTFIIEYEANGQFYIQDSEGVYANYEYGVMQFDEYVAAAGDYLQAGDPIANVHIEVSEADLTEKRLKLQRMKERMEADRILYEKEDALLEKEAYDIEDFEARGVAIRLLMESVEMHKQDLDNQKKRIEGEEEELQKMETAGQICRITAPAQGYLKDLPVFSYADEIKDGCLMGVLEPEKSNILLVNNEENAFRFGKEVVILCKSGLEEKEFKGIVMTPSQNTVTATEGNRKACIEPEEEGIAYFRENEVNSIRVIVNAIEQENAVMVKLGALEEGNNTYATVVQEDGSFLKKKVVLGGKNREYYWVIEGLNAGEKVVVP